MDSLMFPYVLDRKHSINDYLLATEHNKTLFTQIIFYSSQNFTLFSVLGTSL